MNRQPSTDADPDWVAAASAIDLQMMHHLPRLPMPLTGSAVVPLQVFVERLSMGKFWWWPFGRVPEISAQQLQRLMQDRMLRRAILDVRTVSEWNDSRIAGAINVAGDRLKDRLPGLTLDKAPPRRRRVSVGASQHSRCASPPATGIPGRVPAAGGHAGLARGRDCRSKARAARRRTTEGNDDGQHAQGRRIAGEAMKVIIVGGVAGGASCAARLRRLDEKAEILMVERGPYVSYANCGLPYHVSGVIAKESSLLVGERAAVPRAVRDRRADELRGDRHLAEDRRPSSCATSRPAR